jgi:hypothetical protein
MKRAIPILLLLSGCASEPMRQVIEVKVPVTIPCLGEVPAEPPWHFDTIKPEADLFTKVDGLLIEREQRVKFESELTAAMAGCR